MFIVFLERIVLLNKKRFDSVTSSAVETPLLLLVTSTALGLTNYLYLDIFNFSRTHSILEQKKCYFPVTSSAVETLLLSLRTSTALGLTNHLNLDVYSFSRTQSIVEQKNVLILSRRAQSRRYT